MLLEHKPRKTERTKGIESPASKPLKIVARDAFAKRLRNTQTPAGFVAKPSKTHAKKLFHVTFGIHNLQCFWSTSLARRTARKGIESPASKPLKIVARDASAKRLRNIQTPAGFVAKPSKTHAKKTVSRYLWNP